MPKRDVAVKLPSHRLGSAGTLALYGMTDGGKGSVEMSILPVGSKLVGAASRGACGLEGGREKLYRLALLIEGGEGLDSSTSMLQLAATHSA